MAASAGVARRNGALSLRAHAWRDGSGPDARARET